MVATYVTYVCKADSFRVTDARMICLIDRYNEATTHPYVSVVFPTSNCIDGQCSVSRIFLYGW